MGNKIINKLKELQYGNIVGLGLLIVIVYAFIMTWIQNFR